MRDVMPPPLRPFRSWQFTDLRAQVAASRESLDKIGEGDWTPQDSQHARLANAVHALLLVAEREWPELLDG